MPVKCPLSSRHVCVTCVCNTCGDSQPAHAADVSSRPHHRATHAPTARAQAVTDPVVQSDPEYLMVRRAVMMCHGLCAVIGTTLNVAKEWESVARRVLRRVAAPPS